MQLKCQSSPHTLAIKANTHFLLHSSFGGRGITKGGMGRVIENFHRSSPFDAILAGAETVMSDLGVRQAMKKMPKNARL